MGIAWAAFFGWLGGLWLLSAMPGGSVPSVEIPHFDKIVHFGLFFIGAVLFSIALRLTVKLSFWQYTVLTVLALALIGGFDEWHQMSTPGRSGNDMGDWIADCSGALAGALALGWIYARTQKRLPLGASPLAAQGD